MQNLQSGEIFCRSHNGGPGVETENHADEARGYSNHREVLPCEQGNVLDNVVTASHHEQQLRRNYLLVHPDEVVRNLLPVLIDPDLSSRVMLEGSYCDGKNANQATDADANLYSEDTNAL